MDYYGQMWCEYLYVTLVVIGAMIAWIVGYVQNDFKTAVYGWAIASGLAVILCCPDWPLYNKKPVIWLKSVGSTETEGNVLVSTAPSGKTPKHEKKKAE